ncbi:MAG: hypothetical protein LQ340_007332 [Diploschistes diacapsis]|nr:MAG: hypothetical protein LQ340_007332 [Diploschistes diacapsis]
MDTLVATNITLGKELRDYRNEQRATHDARQCEPSPDIGANPDSDREEPYISWRKEDSIARGIEAWHRLKHIRGQRQNSEEQHPKDESMHQALEEDFTTNGAKGDLKCPFAEKAAFRRAMRADGLHKRPRSLPTPPHFRDQLAQDPIAVEFHADAFASPPTSGHGSAAKCPIRFLDDHSPEEIAKYFENHKHEIPRSHEVCVKRHQSNAESIRQLDAKYGNLVNMIQGLGAKHQPMLPSGDDEGKSSLIPLEKSLEKIEHWAETCDDSVPADEASELRTGHFERPLDEVRLGESPSRPWGIQVPLDKQTAASADLHDMVIDAAQSIVASPQSSAQQDPAKNASRKCPFGHGAQGSPTKAGSIDAAGLPPVSKPRQLSALDPEKAPAASNMVFHGPVFFGYPPSGVSEILKALQAGDGV